MVKIIEKQTPLVSVVMPVYNPGAFLTDAIESILNQSYKNFEFIIIDDASTDGSWKTIRFYAKQDCRIRAYKNHINLGVSLTANIAISKAKGKYLARMDSDDISTPDRLYKQISFLKKNPNIILVGSQCTIIDQNNRPISLKKFPLSPHKHLIDMLFWAIPVQQGVMMINKSKLPTDFKWYSPSKISAEEVDLFFNLSHFGQFTNLSDNLYFYRQIPNSLSHQNPKKTFLLTFESRLKAIRNGSFPSTKAIIINFIQLLTILILPSPIINSLWNLIRNSNYYTDQNIKLRHSPQPSIIN